MATHDLDLVRRSNYRTIELNHGRVVFDSSESPASARPMEEPIEWRETPPDSTESI
jgi:ABC-type phosphate/phosphonate transport system ATPase subunit